MSFTSVRAWFLETFEHGFILVEDGGFHLFEVFFALFLRLEGFDVLVCFEEGGADELGVGECFFYVAYGAPVEFFLFFVFEFEGRENGDFVEYEHEDGVAFGGDFVVFAAEDFLHAAAGVFEGRAGGDDGGF